MSEDLEFVRVRECPDGSHPEGDGVFIPRRLGLECGMAARQDMVAVARQAMEQNLSDEEAQQRLTRRWFVTYARHAPVSWTLHEPFDPELLVRDYDLGFPVADRADDLYSGTVMRPLLETAQPTSPTGPTDASTSQPTTSTPSPRGSSSRRSSGGRRSVVRAA